MLETDASSRRHLLSITAFIVLLFGGFALYGTIQRSQQGGHFAINHVGDPAPVSKDRAAFLAERRVWFKVRQVMANHAKKERWQDAVTVANSYLRTKEDATIRLLRTEALFRGAAPQAGADMAKLLETGGQAPPSERALLRGDVQSYRREVQTLLDKQNENQASALEANDSAWQAVLGPMDTEITAKALRLSERAVSSARQSETEMLPAYTNTLGALYARTGRYADALRVLSESERLHHDMINAPFFALAYQGLGDYTKAKAWRDRLRKHLNDTYATRDSQQNRQELLLLWREIDAGVKETPPQTTNGTNYGI